MFVLQQCFLIMMSVVLVCIREGTPGPGVPYEEKKSINGTLSEYLCNIILYHGFEVCISNMRPEPQDSSPR